MSVGDAAPSDALLSHLRQVLTKHPLIKVRIQSDDRARCDEIAQALAEGVPCDFISRTGFTALLAALPESQPSGE